MPYQHSFYFLLEFIQCYLFTAKLLMFKKETNSVLYPDSLGPRKIRRAVVDLVILVSFHGLAISSSYVPSDHRNLFLL